MSIQEKESITFATTYGHLKDTRAFSSRAKIIKVPSFDPMVDYNLAAQIGIFWRVMLASLRYKSLLLYSSRGSIKPELLAIALLGFFPKEKRPAITLNGPMWEPDTGIQGFFEKILITLVDRAVTLYGVQSTGELTIFPQVWGINPSKIRFIPYLFSFTEKEINQEFTQEISNSGNYIFSGGNSHRDYDSLIEAARQLPDHDFFIASHLLDKRPNLPGNVTARQVTHKEFVRLMGSANAVVIPMKMNLRRSTGHQTYLNSMLLMKPTIVNDVLGVRDHIQNMETAIIVDGSVDSYVSSLKWVMDPANHTQLQNICENGARDVLRRFSNENHASKLVELVEEANAIRKAETRIE